MWRYNNKNINVSNDYYIDLLDTIERSLVLLSVSFDNIYSMIIKALNNNIIDNSQHMELLKNIIAV